MDLSTVDHLLTTTHSVKKRLDFTRPVEAEVIQQCIETALYAPSGGNYQGWQFMVVTDREKRLGLGDIYRKGYRINIDSYGPGGNRAQWGDGDVRKEQSRSMRNNSDYLAKHMHEAPALVIACIETDMEEMAVLYQPKFRAFHLASLYGSILPATWSLMLALRARGLGAAWTTAHLICEDEVAELLGIPDHVLQAALLPVAYFKGTDFRPARRRPIQEVTHWNGW